MSKIQPIVSKRNEFTPADEFVENAMPMLPAQFQHENFRGWLLRYTETVIQGVARHFGTAAERGIEQAANLLCDPEFYETRRKKRSEWNRKMREDQVKQDWERIERQMCPTAEQIEDQIKWGENQIFYHRGQIEKYKATLEKLRITVPRNIRITEAKNIN